MTDWIKWNGGDCPIKSDKTLVEYKMNSASTGIHCGVNLRWSLKYNGQSSDIIAYRITEDHEPKMTRDQITAQIEELQKQLNAMPLVTRAYWGANVCSGMMYGATHYFDIETINGVPHIHGVAMKEVGK